MARPKPIPTPGGSPETARLLQPALADLVALSLQAKQAHWNVTGPGFRPLHEFYDLLADSVRGWYDDVAERMLALGVPADGRLSTVARTAELDEFPEGPVGDRRSVELLLGRVEALAGRLRSNLERAGQLDPVTQDMLIEITQGLEKLAWMLRAHLQP